MTPTPTPPCLGEREAVARTGETAWTSYAIARPETAGTYRWRVPSRAVKDLIVTFLAENRTRGAGFETVISPAFDHWNGYSVSVPSGTEWKFAEQPEATPRQSYRCIEVEDLAAAEPCPFCKKRPTIDGNAPWMCAGPHEWHEWYLRCCGMVRAPTYRDPRLAVAAWNSALSPLRTKNETLQAERDAAIARAEEAERTLPERLKPAIAASLKEMGLSLVPEAWIAAMREATADLRSKAAIAADLSAKADKGEAWWGHAHAANDAVAEAKEALALAALTNPEPPHGD